MCYSVLSPSVTRVVYSDASGTGCGGYVVELGPEVSQLYMARAWGGGSCSTLLCSYKLNVKWLSDNQNVVQIIQYGSKKASFTRWCDEYF